MSFLIFFLYYIFSSIILFFILFLCYKLFLKKLIYTKVLENKILSAFDTLDHKSILDIDLPDEKKEQEEDTDEKVYTYF